MVQYKLIATIKRLLENIFKVQINRRSLHGHNVSTDILKSGKQIGTIFDVGANVGHVALRFYNSLAPSRIYCFEPVASTFKTLIDSCARYPNIQCHRIAFGATPGESTIYLTEDCSGCSLLRLNSVIGQESVEVSTVDRFAEENQIARIDLLKIDTEGYDLEVLKGSERMLKENRIVFAIVEVGFHPGDHRHVLFDDVRFFLADFGFSVYGIYEQQLEWSGEPRIRFANACFLNDAAMVKDNRQL